MEILIGVCVIALILVAALLLLYETRKEILDVPEEHVEETLPPRGVYRDAQGRYRARASRKAEPDAPGEHAID